VKLSFLGLPASEQALYIVEAASRRGISPVILEKDFWVCWLLAVLYGSPFASSVVFKGGTSLSKVFGAIDRFSEDIDLSLAPEFLGLQTPGTGKSQSKWMKNAEATCGKAVQEQIAPELEKVIVAVLGTRPQPWLEYQTDSRTKSPVLLFHYPSTQPTGFAYLKRSVKLEFGSLTDQKPTGRYQVQPWIAETIPLAFSDWHCEVVALEAERTFWEKATILHTEHHRSLEKVMPDRFSRHYADTASLSTQPAGKQAIGNTEIREAVVAFKSRFFSCAWAQYELARPGTFRLTPRAERIPELVKDYQAMREMYLNEPPTFETILKTLATLEDEINLGD